MSRPENRVAAERSSPPIPLLGAPTASGKSAVALDLARHFPLEILSADAMQVYRGMDVGTAKPTENDRKRVPHHLIDLVTPAEPFSVAQWVRQAEEAIAEVLSQDRLPLVVGGTGFYLQALSNGLPTVPPAVPAEQEPIWRELEEVGLEALIEELQQVSPVDAQRSQRNPRRVVRAVEIVRRTGRAPSSFPYTKPRFRTSLAVLEPTMDELRPRIAERCHTMFEDGLIDEVRNLLERYPEQATAMQAIGYKEVAAALTGSMGIEQAKQEVHDATVRYAKRQLTWFRRQQADLREANLAAAAAPALRRWLEKLEKARVGS